MTSVSCAKCGLVSWAEEGAACKRCGASAAEMKAPAKPASAPRRVAAKADGHSKPCLHCGRSVFLSKWDDWNGFLVECQHCGGMHGKYWNIRYIMLASFFFNAVSFLFTMRPAAAVPLFSAFVAAGVAGNFFLERLPDTMQVAAVSAFALAPMLVNGVVLLRRHSHLDSSAPAEPMMQA